MMKNLKKTGVHGADNWTFSWHVLAMQLVLVTSGDSLTYACGTEEVYKALDLPCNCR